MADYTYPITDFLEEPSPTIDGLRAAVIAQMALPCHVHYLFTGNTPEVPVTITHVVFSFDAALSAGEQTTLDGIVAAYFNEPAPPAYDYEELNGSVSTSSTSFVTVFTSGSLSTIANGDTFVLLVSVLWNNPASATISAAQWEIETATDTWTAIFHHQQDSASDNKSTNVYGIPWTRFAVLTASMNTPRIRLQGKSSSGTVDINDPQIFALKL